MPTRSLANRLNKLEASANRAEDNASDARWMQAEEIVRLLDAGHTEREIAREWINGRTGEPYDQSEVNRYAATWRKFDGVPHQERPEWSHAYDNRKTSRSERAQQQAPKTVETAEKLSENLVKSSPPEVQRIIYERMRDQVVHKRPHVPLHERKASEAFTKEHIEKPILNRIDNFASIDSLITNLEQAIDLLKRISANESFNPVNMRKIEPLLEDLQEEWKLALMKVGLNPEPSE